MVANEDVTLRPSAPVRALDGLSVTIRDGETMSVVGPSGCGKSTLLRVVAGLERLDEGAIYYDDRLMNDVAPQDRNIGMVFQSYALYPHMRGQENLGFFFRVRQRPSEEMLEHIRITSEIMGIGFDELLERKPRTLSGGQQQRVAIGRCIVRDPTLFLFDEPLSNLDAKLRSRTRVEIKRLLYRFGITAIYVTHDQTEAIALGDRIAVMRTGKFEQVGTYHEIMTDPVNSFVAGFLGLPPMNLLRDWRVTRDGELESDLGHIPVPLALRDQVRPGSKLVLGFHSSGGRIALAGEDIPTKSLLISAEVLNAEPDFAQQRQLVNVLAQGTFFGVEAPLDLHVNTGWQVRVIVPKETVYFFDQQSEARLTPTEG
ncbi:MAG: hypothetical protein A2Y73_00010 [Chloroflexi bacterium RBG_13_56_8]|nr:MAG: hypothetical protein A2Y73_00010 [Chloroflexi bacterium RBG_13_56_8]